MKKVFVYNRGCILRKMDAKLLSEYFVANEYAVINTPEKADIIFLFTCTFIDDMLENGIKDIQKLQKKYDAELIVAGCLPAVHQKEISKVFNGKMISTKDLDKNPEKVDVLFPENKIKFSSIKERSCLEYSFDYLNYINHKRIIKYFQNDNNKINKTYFRLKNYIVRNLFDGRSIVYTRFSKNIMYPIRISWGCYGNCSYCAIKKAVGKYHSKPLELIVNDFKKGIEQGFTDIMLIGDSVGPYGLDIGSSLSELLYKLLDDPGNFNISIINLDSSWVNKYIFDMQNILKKQKIKMLTIPIQSGSERILKLMNRFSDLNKIEETFLRLKYASPNVHINTQAMIGFPTETIDELVQTLKFINKADISSGSMYGFSCKSGTKAELLEPKITNKELFSRIKYSKSFLKKLGYHIVPYIKNKENYFFYR